MESKDDAENIFRKQTSSSRSSNLRDNKPIYHSFVKDSSPMLGTRNVKSVMFTTIEPSRYLVGSAKEKVVNDKQMKSVEPTLVCRLSNNSQINNVIYPTFVKPSGPMLTTRNIKPVMFVKVESKTDSEPKLTEPVCFSLTATDFLGNKCIYPSVIEFAGPSLSTRNVKPVMFDKEKSITNSQSKSTTRSFSSWPVTNLQDDDRQTKHLSNDFGASSAPNLSTRNLMQPVGDVETKSNRQSFFTPTKVHLQENHMQSDIIKPAALVVRTRTVKEQVEQNNNGQIKPNMKTFSAQVGVDLQTLRYSKYTFCAKMNSKTDSHTKSSGQSCSSQSKQPGETILKHKLK